MGKAKEIVSAKLEEFQSTWQRRQIEKALGKIPLQVKSIRENAVSDVFSKDISRLDDESREVLDKVLNYMEKKYISLPISTAKEVLVN